VPTAVFSIVDPPTLHLFDISSVFPAKLSVGRGSIIVNTAVGRGQGASMHSIAEMGESASLARGRIVPSKGF
jgi:hypothetical protein